MYYDNQRYDFCFPNIPNPLSRTETFRCSFFPSAIPAWNSLDSSIKMQGQSRNSK